MLSNDSKSKQQRIGRREKQKAETRARVVEAARALFTERGYEASTIRDIAKRARVAPGSVFTTFATKSELLHEIMYARYAAVFPALADAAARPGDARARLIEMGRVAYDFELRELRITAEISAASWVWPVEDEMENRKRFAPLAGYMAGVLKEAAEAGEIAKDADINLLIEILIGCYVRNVRRALFDGWNKDQLAEHYARQVEFLLRGCTHGGEQKADPI